MTAVSKFQLAKEQFETMTTATQGMAQIPEKLLSKMLNDVKKENGNLLGIRKYDIMLYIPASIIIAVSFSLCFYRTNSLEYLAILLPLGPRREYFLSRLWKSSCGLRSSSDGLDQNRKEAL